MVGLAKTAYAHLCHSTPASKKAGPQGKNHTYRLPQPMEFMDLPPESTHIDVIQQGEPPSGDEESKERGGRKSKCFVTCELCLATFSKRSNFYRHLRRAHNTDSNKYRSKPQGLKGKCPQCDSRFFSRHELLLHLAHIHNHEVVLFNLTFTTKEAYLKWLEDVKVRLNAFSESCSYERHALGRFATKLASLIRSPLPFRCSIPPATWRTMAAGAPRTDESDGSTIATRSS